MTSLFIVLAALLWASDALFRLPLTQHLSSWVIVFMEHLLALVFVLPILWRNWERVKVLNTKQWWSVIFIGVAASALATVAFTASFSYVGPSVAILLQKTQPLFTFLLAFLILRESLPKNFWWWAVVALVGGYLISFPEIVPELSLYNSGAIGIMLALLAAILWGSATVFGRFLSRDLPYTLVTALRFIVALPFLAMILFFNNSLGAVADISWRDFWYLVIIMLGPGFGAMYFYYRGLKVTRASVSALLELTWPLAAVVLNWIFLHEVLSWVQILGGLMLIGAIAKITIWPSLNKTNYEEAYNKI